jgi:hypothetical protein
MFGNLQNLTFTPNSINISNQISLVASTYQPIKGDYQPNQEILFISFGTNSASALNSVEFSLLKLGMITTYSSEFLLM